MKSLGTKFWPLNKFPFLKSLVTQFLGDKMVSLHVFDLKTRFCKFCLILGADYLRDDSFITQNSILIALN